MEKIIKIDLKDKNDLFEKYNNNNINHELIQYILDKAMFVNENEQIKIIINNERNFQIDVINKIIEGLKLELQNIQNEQKRNNLIQLSLLILGIILLFISTLIHDDFVWKEIVLISGWVPIWEVIDIALFKDFKNHKIKSVIKKLINSTFEVQ